MPLSSILLGKILLSGFIILVGAIIINLLANISGLTTWFAFIESLRSNGLANTVESQSLFSLAYLFIIYPFILGALVFLIVRWISF